MLAHESNLFVEKENFFENYKHSDSTEKRNGAIFTCAGFSVSVLWSQHVYVFESHRRNSKEVPEKVTSTKYFPKVLPQNYFQRKYQKLFPVFP